MHPVSCRGYYIKKGVLGNFAKFTGKYLCQSLFFNKVADLRFSMNFAKFFRTHFLQNTSEQLLRASKFVG